MLDLPDIDIRVDDNIADGESLRVRGVIYVNSKMFGEIATWTLRDKKFDDMVELIKEVCQDA